MDTQAIRYHVYGLLKALGEDPAREGLRDTPDRVCRAYAELFAGYGQDPKTVLRTFEDGAQDYDELIVVRDVGFTSLCEHHMMPFNGRAHVGYLPAVGGRIVGLSKLARLVDVFARRLQVQERMTVQVVRALDDILSPRGCGCVVEATHHCLSCRGARKEGAVMVTSALRGVFKTDAKARGEFLSSVRGV